MITTATQRVSVGIMAVLLGGCIRTLHTPPTPDGQTHGPKSSSAPLSPSSVPTASDAFPKPPELDPAVSFWQQVFGVWRAHQIALHDQENLGVVYELVEVSGYIGGTLSAEQQHAVNQRCRRLKAQLNDLEYRLHKRIGLTAEQMRLHRTILRGAGKAAVREAAERIRAQRGMRESFARSLAASGRYAPLFRQVFREAGLPEGLADLPHVESAFSPQARSSKGAVGVWQFMPTTAKRFLVMNRAVDERYDPVLAARGAARYLAYAYGKLSDWGLAVTSYNHGLAGMLRAKEQHGTDIGKVARRYEAPSFGFASRNYYAEFLAVRSILADLPRFFPEGVEFEPPVTHRRMRLARAATVGELAKWHGVHYTTLASMNPAWSKAAAEGRVALPANIEIWLPRAATSPHGTLFAREEVNGRAGPRTVGPVHAMVTSARVLPRNRGLSMALPASAPWVALGFGVHSYADDWCYGAIADSAGIGGAMARLSRFQFTDSMLDAPSRTLYADSGSRGASPAAIRQADRASPPTELLELDIGSVKDRTQMQTDGAGGRSDLFVDTAAGGPELNVPAAGVRGCLDPVHNRQLIRTVDRRGEALAMLQHWAAGVWSRR
jgi:membrane-bound lytic murein transglycosylase D